MLYAIYHRRINNKKVFGLVDINDGQMQSLDMVLNGKQIMQYESEALKTEMKRGGKVANLTYKVKSNTLCSKYKALPDLDSLELGETAYPLLLRSWNTGEKELIIVYINVDLCPMEHVTLMAGYMYCDIHIIKVHDILRYINKYNDGSADIRCVHINEVKGSGSKKLVAVGTGAKAGTKNGGKTGQKTGVGVEAGVKRDGWLDRLEKTVCDENSYWTLNDFEYYMKSKGYTYNIENNTIYSVDVRCKYLHIPMGVSKIDCLYNGIPHKDTVIIIPSSVITIFDISTISNRKMTEISSVLFQKSTRAEIGSDKINCDGLKLLKITGKANLPDRRVVNNLFNKCEIHKLKYTCRIPGLYGCFNNIKNSEIILSNSGYSGVGDIDRSFVDVCNSKITISARNAKRMIVISRSFNYMDYSELDLSGVKISTMLESSLNYVVGMQSLTLLTDCMIRGSLENSDIRRLSINITDKVRINHPIGNRQTILELWIVVTKSSFSSGRGYSGELNTTIFEGYKKEYYSGLEWRFYDAVEDKEISKDDVGLDMKEKYAVQTLGEYAFEDIDFPDNIVSTKTSKVFSTCEIDVFDSAKFPLLEMFNVDTWGINGARIMILENSIKSMYRIVGKCSNITRIIVGKQFEDIGSLVNVLRNVESCIVYCTDMDNYKKIKDNVDKHIIPVIVEYVQSENEARRLCSCLDDENTRKHRDKVRAMAKISNNTVYADMIEQYGGVKNLKRLYELLTEPEKEIKFNEDWYGYKYLSKLGIPMETLKRLSISLLGLLALISRISEPLENGETLDEPEKASLNMIVMDGICIIVWPDRVKVTNCSDVVYESRIKEGLNVDKYGEYQLTHYIGANNSVSKILAEGDRLPLENIKNDLSGIRIEAGLWSEYADLIDRTFLKVCEDEKRYNMHMKRAWFIDLVSGDYIQAFYTMGIDRDVHMYTVIKVCKYSDELARKLEAGIRDKFYHKQ